jgi:Uma2 family endonuclease
MHETHAVPPSVPPLREGDRLTRDEFECRYAAMPHVKKAELINGVVYITRTVRLRGHAQPHSRLGGWLGLYEAATPGVQGSINGSHRLDSATEPQPDLTLLIDPARGGQARISGDGFVEGAPELAGEIADDGSASLDLGQKLLAYQQNRVCEYVVWHVPDRHIHWFVLRGERYGPLPPDGAGVFRSEVFPGLWLDAPALLRGDLAAVQACVQRGTATAEHAAFVERLRANGR